jgi:hypothetical protein
MPTPPPTHHPPQPTSLLLLTTTTTTTTTSPSLPSIGNVLYLNGPSSDQQTFTLTSGGLAGFYKKFEACLVPGVYRPYACGGVDGSEVWWSVGGISGSATSTCEEQQKEGGRGGGGEETPIVVYSYSYSPGTTGGKEEVGESGGSSFTVEPCQVFQVELSDTFGDG